MPPWGAGSKPKKTPANTVKNTTYSTSNRFGGPPSVSGRMGPQSGPPGSGQPSQISRPALAAAAAARGPRTLPGTWPPTQQQPRTLPGTWPPTQQQPQPYVSPAAVDRRATTQPSNTADRNMVAQANRAGAGSYNPNASAMNAAARRSRQTVVPSAPSQADLSAQRYAAAAEAYKDPATYAKSQATPPSPNELAGMRYQRAAETYTADPAAYAKAQAAPAYGTTGAMGWQPSQQELMRAATSGAATAPAASRVAQKPPTAPSFSQEELMRAATSGAATHPAAQAIQQPAPVSTGPTDEEVHNWLGTPEAQRFLGITDPAPAWDPANNDAPITDPIGMWTDPTSGGQMPDPADADAWQAMQDAVDSEFGPNQSIYNPTYSGGVDPYVPAGGPAADNYGSGPTASLGTFNPSTGEYLQFGLDLAQNTSDYGKVGEGRAFWNQAQDRKWDEYDRSLPGQFNSRGMMDSGLLNRAEGLAASDRRFETDVRQWSDNERRAELERQRMNLYGGFEGGLTRGLVDNYLAGTLVMDDPLTAMDEAMGSGAGGYIRSGIMDRTIPAYGPPR